MATLIMVNSIEHGENIEKYLKEAKVPYAYVQGADDNDTRTEVLDKVRGGEIKILLATKIFDAGIDVPNLKYFISCSSGKSFVSTLQRIGRLLRVAENKNQCYILDIVDRESEYLYKQSQERIKYYKQEKFEVS
jgi:superfamily II DNA or RNA helicase